MNETLDTITESITDEMSAQKYLTNLRWGQWANCPYCNNKKAYFIENGTRYKCANKSCYKKFSVTTMTLMSSTNLQYYQWIKAAIFFIKTRGRCHYYDIEREISISPKAAVIIKDKFDFCWKRILPIENKDHPALFRELFTQMFTLYEFYEQFKQKVYNTSYHISNISDMKDPASFDKLLHYVQVRLFFCKYIYINFASPGEIMTEVYLWLYDNNIKDYDADFIIKIINRTISRMWVNYKKEHPNLHRQHLAKCRQRKFDKTANLSTTYLVECIKSTKIGKDMSRGQIRADKVLLKECKDRILGYRLKTNKLSDWHSHFD